MTNATCLLLISIRTQISWFTHYFRGSYSGSHNFVHPILLEISVIIKISSPPWFPINYDWFESEWSKKKFFEKQKILRMADSKKLRFSTPPILNIFSQKIWGLQEKNDVKNSNMADNQCGCQAVRCNLKKGIKTQKIHFYPFFELTSDSLTAIYLD